MEFVKELQEARLTRTGNVKTLTYQDCCERLYLTLLTLQLLNNYNSFKPAVRSYIIKTIGRDYGKFSTGSTDLYNYIYFVTGDDEAQDKLKDPGAAKRARARTTLPLNRINGYLRELTSGLTNSAQEVLIKVESALNITNSDYKTVRRNICNYKKIDQKSKQDSVTRLLIAARAKLRSSDIIDDLSKLAAEFELETGRVADNEPTVSVPDVGVSGKDLLLYRYLVGTQNLAQCKRFLELARDGRSIPSVQVNAYLPIIKMIDDIVQSGPGAVQMLRQVHKTAKKMRK